MEEVAPRPTRGTGAVVPRTSAGRWRRQAAGGTDFAVPSLARGAGVGLRPRDLSRIHHIKGGPVMANQRSHAVGVFTSRPQAERAVEELRRAGFKGDQIAVVMHHVGHDVVEVTDLDAAKAADV